MNAVSCFAWGLLVSLAVCRQLGVPGSRIGTALRIAGAALLLAAASLVALWFVPDPFTLPAFCGGASLGTLAMRGEGLRPITAAISGSRLALYLLSVATLATMVYLFVPITTFLTSPGELGIHLGYLVANNAREAVAVFYVCLALYAVAATSRMRTALTLLALSAVLLALLYTYVLPFGYPMMAGLVFEQVGIGAAAAGLRLAVDALVVVAVALGLRAALLRFGARPFVVALLLLDVALCAVAGVSIQRERFGGSGGQQTSADAERPLRFSKSQPNVLFIFMDRYMGSYVEQVLHSDPDLATRLAGFTWYPRSVSPGENSIAGVHPMLGGYDYTPDAMNARHKSLRDVSVEAFSILPYNFTHHGWHVNMVSPRGLGFTMAGDCSYLQMPGVNCTHISKTFARDAALRSGFPLEELAKSNYTDLLVLLGSMRSSPYVVKELLLERGEWKRLLDHSAGTTFREWVELHAWPALTETGAGESNMNFISNILAHEPYFMGEDCKPLRQRFAASEEVVAAHGYISLFAWQHAIAARCALLGVADYLDYLKSVGVYDNTRIIIVSDHGIVGPVEDSSTRARAGGTQDDNYVRTRSVLLVKPREAHGPLVISEDFMPNAEAPRIACEELGGCVNPYLDNKPIATLGRDDPFHVTIVPWQFNLQNADSFVIDESWVLMGRDPFDARGWKQTR